MLRGAKAWELAKLGSHDTDLARADAYLSLLESAPHAITAEALYHSAIVRFARCFASGSRQRLPWQTIYVTADAVNAYSFFDQLRNNYIAHDLNAYAQRNAVAVLNRRDASPKVEEVSCMSTLSNVVNPSDIYNLRLLILARAWIAQQFDALATEILAELEATPCDDLLKCEGMSIKVPTASQAKKHKRKKNTA